MFRMHFKAHKWFEFKGWYFNSMTINWADGQRMSSVLTDIFTFSLSSSHPWKERVGKNNLTRAERTLSNKLWFLPACLCFCFQNTQLHISHYCKHLLFKYISYIFNTFFFLFWGSIVNKFTGQIWHNIWNSSWDPQAGLVGQDTWQRCCSLTGGRRQHTQCKYLHMQI